jgi:hypothetical protein
LGIQILGLILFPWVQLVSSGITSTQRPSTKYAKPLVNRLNEFEFNFGMEKQEIARV